MDFVPSLTIKNERPPTTVPKGSPGSVGSLRTGSFDLTATSITLKFSENKRVRPIVQDQLDGKVNYFIGNDHSAWRTSIPTYEKVVYRDVYDGIDLVYNGDQRRLKYTFYLQPNSDPSHIKMIYDGIEGLSIDQETGELILQTPLGEIRDAAPTAYQTADLPNRR